MPQFSDRYQNVLYDMVQRPTQCRSSRDFHISYWLCIEKFFFSKYLIRILQVPISPMMKATQKWKQIKNA